MSGAAKSKVSLWLQGPSGLSHSLPARWADAHCPHPPPLRPYHVVGEAMGQDFTTVEAGQMLAGVGLDLEQEGAGPVYVAGKRSGGPAALCGELLTEHGVERGRIQDHDVLLAIDGDSVTIGVDSDATMQAVRTGILGPPGTIVMLHFEREGGFRYHVKLARVMPSPRIPCAPKEPVPSIFLAQYPHHRPPTIHLAPKQEAIGEVQPEHGLESQTVPWGCSESALNGGGGGRGGGEKKDKEEPSSKSYALLHQQEQSSQTDASFCPQGEKASTEDVKISTSKITRVAPPPPAQTLLNESEKAVEEEKLRPLLDSSRLSSQELDALLRAISSLAPDLESPTTAQEATTFVLQVKWEIEEKAQLSLTLESTVARISMDIALAISREAKLQKELEEVKSREAAVKENLAALQRENTILAESKKVIVSKDAEIEDLKERLKDATDIIKSRYDAISTQGAQIAGLQSEIQDLRKQLPEAKRKAAELEADLKKSKVEMEKLLQQNEALQQEIVGVRLQFYTEQEEIKIEQTQIQAQRAARGSKEMELVQARLQLLRSKIIAGIIRKWTHQSLAGTFSLWKQHTLQNRQLRFVAARVVKRWRNGELNAAFGMWREHANEQRRLARCYVYAYKQRGVAKKVLKHWKHRTTSAAFESWHAHASEQKKLKTLFTRVLHHLLNRKLSITFETWREHSLAQKRMETVGGRIIARMLNGTLAAALVKWREHASEQRHMQDVCSRVLLKVMHRGLDLAFCTWKRRSSEQKEQKAVCTRVLRHMLNRKLSIAYHTWKEHSFEQKRMETVGGRIIARMLNGTLAAALVKWKEHASEQRHMQDVCSRVILKVMHRGLATAWKRWLDHYLELARLLRMSNRVLARWSHGCLASSWEKWFIELCRSRKIRVFAFKFLNKALARAWNTWCEEHARCDNRSMDDSSYSALPSSVPKFTNLLEKRGGVDVSLVLGLDFWQAGQEGMKELKRIISEDLAFASGWERQQSNPLTRMVYIERRKDLGIGISFSFPSKLKQSGHCMADDEAAGGAKQGKSRSQAPQMSQHRGWNSDTFCATWSAGAGHRMAIDKVAGQVSFSKYPPPSDQQIVASAKIKAVTAGSPAALSGLKEGERIFEIDDKPVSAAMDSKELAAMLRGGGGTVVRLRVGPPEDNAAKGLPPECFVIKNLMPLVRDSLDMIPESTDRLRRRASAGEVFECDKLHGQRSSIHVHVTVLPLASNKSPHPGSVAGDLASQAHDPASRLRTGSLTRHLQSVTVTSLPGQHPAASTKSTARALDLHSLKPDTDSDVPQQQKLVSVVCSDTGCVGLAFTRQLGEDMKPRILSMVSLDIPVTDLTDRHTLLFSQERRNIFENNIKVQVCATLHVPSACVTVFVVAPCPDHENCLLASQRVITVKVILSDVVDRFGDVTMKAKDMMVPLAEAAIDPGSKFAAGDLPTAVHSRTLGFMSFPVAKFLESLARQVLELQVNLNSECRNGPRLSLSPLQPELQRLAVSQTCLKSSEDKGIIDARKGTHSPRLVVSQACLIIDDIPDNSFMDMLVTSQPLDPQADGLEGADHGGDVQVCDEMGERRLRVDIASSPATGRTHRQTATGILHDVLTIGQYAGALIGMDLRALPEAPGGGSSGDAHPVKRMDEGVAEGLPPGEAESVSIDTVGELYAENGTELRCLSTCGQLFDLHSPEVLASPRDGCDEGSNALLPPTTMGRASSSPFIGIDESFRFAFANF